MARGLQAGFRLGKFMVFPETGELHCASDIAVLHPQTMKLLVYLAEHSGELIPSRQLSESVWPSASVSDETVRLCVRELRHRLRDDADNPTFIETSSDGGYRLIAPVTPSQIAASEAPPSPLQRFLGQMKRRKVFRVLAGYTVVGWLLLQVADVLSEGVPWLPENTLTILIILLASGFPIALVLAWWLEITDSGIVLDPETERRWPQMAKAWRPAAMGLALAGGAGLAAFLLTRQEVWQGERLAAAVLPFIDLSVMGAASSCGWLTEEMTDALANIRELRVSARTSSESLAAAKLAIPEIAERLRVNYVVEGSCSADSDRLRVTAQLIEAGEGFHVWSQVYDVPLSERLKVVREIARNIARTMEIKLSDESKRRLGRVPTTNDQAYAAYQQGRRYLEMAPEDGNLTEAEGLFKRSIDLDPGFAEARAGLCETYLAWYRLQRDVARYKQAESTCLEALEAGEFAAQVYVALGDLYRYNGQYQRAYDAFWRASELDDSLADAYIGSARVLALMDRPAEAESSFLRAIELEPGSWLSYNAYGGYLFQVGRFAEAAKQFSEIVSLNPSNPMGYNNLGGAYFYDGRFADAAGAFEQSLELAAGRDAYTNTGTMYFYAGAFQKAASFYRKALKLAPNDYRVWGSLGDALAAEDNSGGATDAYREASRLAAEALELNAADTIVRAELAHYLARLGHAVRAVALIEKAIGEEPADMHVLYNAALVFATLGDESRSLDTLERAVDLGYQAELLPVDPGLKRIKSTQRFNAIASRGTTE